MFGIDTLTISHHIRNIAEWEFAKCSLVRKGGSRWQYQYKKQGIHRITFPCNEEFGYYALRLQLSPATLLERVPYSITPIELIREQLPQKLTRWLVERTGINNWDSPLHWVLDRVDYATDISELMQEDMSVYIALARSGAVPASFKKLHKDCWTSSAIYGNKNERIQFYDKGHQMRKRHPDAGEAVLAAYQGVLRVEVQLKKDRLSHIRHDVKWPDRTLEQFLRQDLAETIVRQRVTEVVGFTAFTNAGSSLQRLAAHRTNGVVTLAKQKKLSNFISFVQDQPSLQVAKNFCSTGMGPVSAATFSKYLGALSELGIAMPLIPGSYKLKSLPALLPQPADGAVLAYKEWKQRQKSAREQSFLTPLNSEIDASREVLLQSYLLPLENVAANPVTLETMSASTNCGFY